MIESIRIAKIRNILREEDETVFIDQLRFIHQRVQQHDKVVQYAAANPDSRSAKDLSETIIRQACSRESDRMLFDHRELNIQTDGEGGTTFHPEAFRQWLDTTVRQALYEFGMAEQGQQVAQREGAPRPQVYGDGRAISGVRGPAILNAAAVPRHRRRDSSTSCPSSCSDMSEDDDDDKGRDTSPSAYHEEPRSQEQALDASFLSLSSVDTNELIEASGVARKDLDRSDEEQRAEDSGTEMGDGDSHNASRQKERKRERARASRKV